MSKEVRANLTHITIFGNRNAGKSSFFNAFIGQDIAITDETLGTTTDPVTKRFELLPYGAIVLTDTAGLDDEGVLGTKRIEKTLKLISRTDFAILIYDALNVEQLEIEQDLIATSTPYIKVYNKTHLVKDFQADGYMLTDLNADEMIGFKSYLISKLGLKVEKSLIADKFKPGSNIVLVVPIDSEAPAGRIILPQVQVIRDCLDHNVNAIVTNETNLDNILNSMHVDLVITDSQAFVEVNKIVNKRVALTSFSIVFANFKAELSLLVECAHNVDLLEKCAKILICESCSHNVGHEDIGYVKIPNLLKKRLGNDISITHKMGIDFVEDIQEYDLVIHCGSCMLNSKVMKYRQALCKKHNIPMTNYGVYLAYEAGILDQAVEVFKIK